MRVAREKERELKELERASRTVFAFNLNIKADERDIWELFSPAGEVTDIRIITDRNTRRSKGLAYVEFKSVESVFAALALTGQQFMGQAVMVKPAEAEKNLAWEAQQAAKANQADAAALLAAAGIAPEPARRMKRNPAAAAGGDAAAAAAAPGGAAPPRSRPPGPARPPPGAPPLELLVTGFPAGLGEGELRQVFEPFGKITDVTMVRDASGADSACRVTFANALEGQIAMGHWHGNELIGCKLSVTAVGGAAAAAPAGAPLAPPPPTAAELAAAAGADLGELDDDGSGGLKLDSAARAALMSRLAGGAGAAAADGAGAGAGAPPPADAAAAAGPAPTLVLAAGAPQVDAAVLFAQGVLGPPSPVATPALLLKNVWRAEQTLEPGWEAEVGEDMAEELSKCGQLLHMHIDTASNVSAVGGLCALRCPCLCRACFTVLCLRTDPPHAVVIIPSHNKKNITTNNNQSLLTTTGLRLRQICRARGRAGGAPPAQRPLLLGQPDPRRVPVCRAVRRALWPRVISDLDPI